MAKVRLDQETADRMLTGMVGRADVPPGFEAVAELLDALRATTQRPVHAHAGGPAVIDARRAGGQIRKQRPRYTATSFRPRISILAAALALSATTGAAFAAGLPAGAVGPASAVLHRLGIGVPAAPAPAVHPANHGATVAATATTATATGSAKGALISAVARAGKRGAGTGGDAGAGGSAHGKGATISTLARTTTATGAAKGATISAAASGGKSHAGEHGHRASGHGAAGHDGGKPSGGGHGHGHNPG